MRRGIQAELVVVATRYVTDDNLASWESPPLPYRWSPRNRGPHRQTARIPEHPRRSREKDPERPHQQPLQWPLTYRQMAGGVQETEHLKGLGQQSPRRELPKHRLWRKPPERGWEGKEGQATITLRIQHKCFQRGDAMSVQNARYRKAQHVQRSSTIKYYQVYHQSQLNTAGFTTCH